MKKLTTLFILSFFVVLFAQAAPYLGGKLTIYSHNTSTIQVLIDGRRYPLEYNMLVLNDIAAGNHTIKIVERSTPATLINREKVLYNGSVYIRTNYHTDIVINRFGKTFIDEQEITGNGLDDEYGDYSYGTAMNDAAFETLKKSLQQERFSSNRMNLAKQAISNNYFTTEQVRQMAQLFSFEDEKMQLVKQAYPKTVDRTNYYLLSSLFSFSSNKEALTRFIQENSNSYDNGTTERVVISDADFSKLKSRIQSSFSESTKLTTAKQGIDENYFTSSQVKDLVLLFSYDSGKLDIAKYAYGKTLNQADYLLYLSDVFASRTSKDELNRYIANYR